VIRHENCLCFITIIIVVISDFFSLSIVGIALGYGLNDRDSRVRFPAGAGNFSLHHLVQTCSGAHPASCPMCTRGFLPGDKATEE
jgi:hypothetical protein